MIVLGGEEMSSGLIEERVSRGGEHDASGQREHIEGGREESGVTGDPAQCVGVSVGDLSLDHTVQVDGIVLAGCTLIPDALRRQEAGVGHLQRRKHVQTAEGLKVALGVLGPAVRAAGDQLAGRHQSVALDHVSDHVLQTDEAEVAVHVGGSDRVLERLRQPAVVDLGLAGEVLGGLRLRGLRALEGRVPVVGVGIGREAGVVQQTVQYRDVLLAVGGEGVAHVAGHRGIELQVAVLVESGHRRGGGHHLGAGGHVEARAHLHGRCARVLRWRDAVRVRANCLLVEHIALGGNQRNGAGHDLLLDACEQSSSDRIPRIGRRLRMPLRAETRMRTRQQRQQRRRQEEHSEECER
mmetsp:Transcript_42791/g.107996  ORF Transcript_42791/g.107996 Transcript_42791/m.107996 type:complete len:353 (+) Transcript_42791:367-1425(+)